MKTINDLKEGDTIWFQVLYGTTMRTKEVRQARVRHIVQDDDMVSKLTGIRRAWIHIIEFDGAPRLNFAPKDGDTSVFSTMGISNTQLVYYTDKSLLLAALKKEKQRLQEEVDAFIAQVK